MITGGSSGIGAATARLLAEGYRVAVTGRSPDRLEQFAAVTEAKPQHLLTLPGDAADHEAVETAVRTTEETFGRLDVVANAGYATHDSLADGDPTGWHDRVLTNVLGHALLIRYALAPLKATRGRSVLIGSVAGVVYTPGTSTGRRSGPSPGSPRTPAGR